MFAAPSFPAFWTPKFLHFRWKIKICDKISVWLVNRFPKWYVMTPLYQNSQTSGVLGKGPFADQGPGVSWSQLTYSTIRHFCWTNPEKFSLFHAADQKLFHSADQKLFHYTARQTHRHTQILHPMCMGEIFFLFGILYLSQHYIHFAHSLTLFVKDKM